MLITLSGSATIGSVWGWMTGSMINRTPYSLLNGLVPEVGTILRLILVCFSASWLSLAFFLGASGLALLVHSEWLQRLRTRFVPPNCEGGI